MTLGTAENLDVKYFQDGKVALVTDMYTLQICQQHDVKVKLFEHDLHRQVQDANV